MLRKEMEEAKKLSFSEKFIKVGRFMKLFGCGYKQELGGGNHGKKSAVSY